MNVEEFRLLLDRLELTQRDVAQLTGVTFRAVNLWATGNRPVPGPVISYLRLLELAPKPLRDAEKARLGHQDLMIKEGIYSIEFTGRHGMGAGMLILENARLYGSDAAGGRYDGTYGLNRRTGLIDAEVKVTIPPDVLTVQGVAPKPYEWSFTAKVSFPRQTDRMLVEAETSIGPVNLYMAYLRSLPED